MALVIRIIKLMKYLNKGELIYFLNYPTDDEEDAATRPMPWDENELWESDTKTLTYGNKVTLNKLIYKGLSPRFAIDQVTREVRERQLRIRDGYPPEFHHLFTD